MKHPTYRDYKIKCSRIQRKSAVVMVLLLFSTLMGCVSAPPETVQLVDVVSEQSSALEASHRSLVNAYFDELEESIDRFVDNQWTPDFLSRAVANPAVIAAIDEVKAGIDIDTDSLHSAISSSGVFNSVETDIIVSALDEAKIGYRAQFGRIMIEFNSAAVAKINLRRRELKVPLRTRKLELQNALDEGYANLHQGQATLKAYLESVVEVVAAQDEFLQKINIIEERNAAMDSILKISDEAADAVITIDNAAGALDNFLN